MTRKSTLSPASAAVINHLKEHGHKSAALLCSRFPDMSRAQLFKRLGNLVALGWLDVATNDAGERIWLLRASARAIAVHTTAAQEPVQAPAQPPQSPQLPVVAPRSINVMAGIYVPPRGPALRPGALDFKACPSVGYRC